MYLLPIFRPKSPNKQTSQPPKTTVRKKSRYTQVTPEDIDHDNMRKFNRLETTHGEDKPIDPTGLGEIVPQCRLCLRRVSREHLEIFEGKHRKTARVAFQIRIFSHDAYPFICSNCLNLMDIFIDFKYAVTQAKSLLVNKKAYLDSNGWDNSGYIDAFQTCKQVVELHRKQIDTLYDELANTTRNKHIDHVDDDKAEDDYVENNDTDDPEDVASSLFNEIPNTEIIEEEVPNAEEVEITNMEATESIADDSMDEDFIPEGEEDDDEDYDPEEKKPKIIKTKKSATAANAGEDKPVRPNKPSVSRKLCDFCGKYVRPELVESHRNAHLGLRPYPCSVEGCTQRFTSRYNVAQHIIRIHKESKVHTCNICGKQIRGTLGVLKYHQKRHNDDKKKHICHVCGKGFAMKWYLTQHSIIHTGDYPHKCQYCGKKPKSPNKQSSQPPKTTVRKRSRYTQVTPEDIDLDNMGKLNRMETLGEDKPIDPTGLGEIVPQCRLCLRRVSRENLEIFESKHRKKARVAFQIRIFPHDAYPFICFNCLTLMDMFIDFKNAVTQAKSLLVNEKAFLESNGWDDPDYIDIFQKCKQIVELHRKQIDSMYEELANPPKKEYVDDHVDDDKTEEDIVEDNDVDDPEYEATIKPECIITEAGIPSLPTENPKTEMIEQNAEEVGTGEIEVAESIADDSMDEDFIPEGEEEDDDDFNPKVKKPKTVKIKKAATKADSGVDKTSGNKQLVPIVKRQLCDFCGASVRPESVESHRNAHLGIRPYACSVEGCVLKFTSRFNLGKHVKRIHKDSEIHTCNICGKQIRGNLGVLKYHQQRHNVDQKNHICQVCGKGFTMKWYLTQHSVIHTGDFPHKCKYCGKKCANKPLPPTEKQRKIQPIRNRSTQVNAEEIDAWSFQKSHEYVVPGEDKPIRLIDNVPVEPQCRFCLRRVSSENLKIISNEHKSKAMVAFHLKVFPRDAYPYACTNCLNLLDICVDFKSSVTKAKRLLLTKRMHLESDGWDDAIVTEAFQQCKGAVERHRRQIDAVYEECFELTQQESTQTVAIDNSYNKQVEDNLNNSEKDVVEVLYYDEERIEDNEAVHTVELELDQIEHLQNDEIIEGNIEVSNTVELELDQIEHLPNEERIEDNLIMSDESNSEQVFEEIDEPSMLQSSEDNNSSSNEKPDDNFPGSSKPRSIQSRKKKPATVFSTKQSVGLETGYLPTGLRVLCDLCGQSMYSESLESHKNRHLGIKPYTCPVSGCGFTFYSRANMATHMRRMHAEKGREEHKCDICGKFIRGQPGCLNVHKKRHTNEKKFVCNLCGKGFTMTAYLRQHMLSHSAEFPHQCRYCGKKFNIKYSMRSHEKTIHEKNNHAPQS